MYLDALKFGVFAGVGDNNEEDEEEGDGDDGECDDESKDLE